MSALQTISNTNNNNNNNTINTNSNNPNNNNNSNTNNSNNNNNNSNNNNDNNNNNPTNNNIINPDNNNNNNNKNQIKSKELSDELRECLKLLSEIKKSTSAEAFLSPVDWQTLKLPDYPVIIKKPMDLGTITAKLQNFEYDDAYDFAEEVRLVWKNAKMYNTPGSHIYINAENLSQQFERRFPRIKKAFSARSKHQKKALEESTQEDRMKFTKLIKQITSDQLGQIVEIIDKKAPQALNDSEGEEDLEIEVYYIDNETLQDLISFCEKCIRKTNKKKKNK